MTATPPVTAENIRTRNVEIYDFRRPTTLAREHSRVLEQAFESFARQWGNQLTAKVRTRSQAQFDNVAMTTYADYVNALPSSTAMSLIAVGENPARGVLQFDTDAALSWFNRMLGGNGSIVIEDRKFTPIEHSMLRKLVDDSLDDLTYSLGPLIGSDDLTFDSVHHSSQFAQAAGTTELMIVATFTVQVGDRHDTATLALPADAVLQSLGTTNPVVNTGDVRSLVSEQLTRVPVTVSLQMRALPVKPADVLGLTVGDIIRLPHPDHRPFNLTVDSQLVATATHAASASRLACMITETQENHR